MAQYTQRTQPMHSHVTWLEKNIKQNIIAFDDIITICQLHLDFGDVLVPVQPSQAVQSSQPPTPKRSTATKSVQYTPTKSVKQTPTNSVQCISSKSVQHTSMTHVNIAPYPSKTPSCLLYQKLCEPSTSKAEKHFKKCREGDEEAVENIELYYKNSDIERQVIDIERSVNAHVVKKRRVSLEASNDAEEVLVISDDDDDVVMETEISPTSLIEVDDDSTKSGNENLIDKITNDEIILIDRRSPYRPSICIDPNSELQTSIKEEPEDNDGNEEEVILPNCKITTNLEDTLQIDILTVKAEPEEQTAQFEDGIADLEYEEAQFQDKESEVTHIKEESPDNTIDIGETVIQKIPSDNNVLDNILSTLVEKNFMTVKETEYLSSILDMNCIFNVNYKFNDNFKVFAQKLYLCSEEAYNFMANYIPRLPSVKQIKETFITLHGAPGFSAEALDCLKMKVKLKKNAKQKPLLCTLAINDIELKACSRAEKYEVAFVITAVALNASWKLPICYLICPDLMNSRKREQLIQLAITLVERSGVVPKAVSYLPIFQNIEMAERLIKGTSNENNNMFVSESGKAMYLIPDPVYIFDKFRICGCEDKDGRLISLRHIELLVKHLGRVRPGQITNRLLGKSLTFSLEVCADDFLSSGLANVHGTVGYLKLINNFLDIMTSHPGGTYWKDSMSGNTTKVLKFLEYFEEYLSKISPKYKSNPFWLNNTSRGLLKFDTQSLMDVLIMAVHGAQTLIRFCFDDISMKKLTMNSTTFLANFYNVVDNGELKENTVPNFTARYKENLRYMKPHSTKTGYIIPIENISVLDTTSPVQRINVTTYLLNSNNVNNNKQFEKDTTDDLYKILKFDGRGEYINLTKIYIAGYVVYNLVRRLRCDTCISALLRLNHREEDDPYNTEIVIKKTELDSSDKLCVKLMDPSVDVVRICNATDVVYKRAVLQSNAANLDILQRFSIPLLKLKIKKAMIGRDYFKSLDFHRHDTDTLGNHVVELANAVAEVYLEIRLKYRSLCISSIHTQSRSTHTRSRFVHSLN